VHRNDQPYVAIKALVTMEALEEVLPGLHREVRGWLLARGAAPCGDPFFKYNVSDMGRGGARSKVSSGMASRATMAKDGQPA